MVRKMVGIVVFDFLAGSLFTRKVLNPYQEMHLSGKPPPCVMFPSQQKHFLFQSKKLAWHTTKKIGESPLISLILQTPTFLKLTHRHLLLLCLLTQRSLFK